MKENNYIFFETKSFLFDSCIECSSFFELRIILKGAIIIMLSFSFATNQSSQLEPVAYN